MQAFQWIYRRIGQVACFAAAFFLLVEADSSYGNNWTAIIFGVAFLFAGLALRWMMLAYSGPDD